MDHSRISIDYSCPTSKEKPILCKNCKHPLYRSFANGLQHEREYGKMIGGSMMCEAKNEHGGHCNCINPEEEKMVETKTDIAKRAWVTRRKNLALKNNEPIKTSKNPYDWTTETLKAKRWHYWMKRYGVAPPDMALRTPEGKRFNAKSMGIKKYKHLTPAQKAWVTRRKNHPKLTVTKDYDAPKKNAFRKMIARSFRKIGGTCLALESPDFYFAKELPGMTFVIFENNEIQYRKMKNPPENVKKVHFSDVKNAPELARDERFSCAFLDYCKTFQTQEEDLMLLRDKLSSCFKIAFTFSLRSAQWKTTGGYQYELAQRLLKIFDKYEIEYGNGYHDQTTMVGLILVRKDYQPFKKKRLGPSKMVSIKKPLELLKKVHAVADKIGVNESEAVRRMLEKVKIEEVE